MLSEILDAEAEKYPAPEHMDFFSRNDRLYKLLLSVGLFVEPVFTDDSRTDIDYLRVSASLPLGAGQESGQGQLV